MAVHRQDALAWGSAAQLWERLGQRLRAVRADAESRAAVERMLGWAPERIIVAHGRWFERDGTNALERAFRWLLR